MTATSRLEVRVDPARKAAIERAASLLHEPVSKFVLEVVEQRAAEVIAEHETRTRVPESFFDDLLAALDETPEPSPALARAARRGSKHVTQR